MSTSLVYSHLPSELWICVFYWATYSSARNWHHFLEVPLFDGIYHREDETQTKESMSMKTNLALVCREWRALSEQYLYEDLRIRHGKRILADALQSSRKECPQGLGKGRYVVRIVLPNMYKEEIGYGHSRYWADKDISRIVECCPNLVVLSRYHRRFTKELNSTQREGDSGCDMSTEMEDRCLIHDPPLLSIRRLDWFNGGMIGDPWHPTICAVPSWLWTSQQLEVLSPSGDNYFWSPAELQSLSGQVVLLPKVRTLRVGSIHAFGVPGIFTYTLVLPVLRRIVLDRGEALHRLIGSVVASPSLSPDDEPVVPDVTALEVGSLHWRFTRSDYISTFIRHYPTAESLYYPVFFVRPLRWRHLQNDGLSYGLNDAQKVFSNLRHVGLHAQPNPELSCPEGKENIESIWSHLYAHVRALLGSALPNLLESRLPGIRSITLYGISCLPLVTNPRFHIVLDLARQRDAVLYAEDPGVANALQDAISDYITSLVFEWIDEL